MSADAIHLAAYDPKWPSLFKREAQMLQEILPRTLAYEIEHFGSTAVPGLAAKPVIDILLLVPQRARWSELVAPIQGLGYEFWRENPTPDAQLYVKGRPPKGNGRTHHVHVRLPVDAARELQFRDLLRADPDLNEGYARLKAQLAERYHLDREAYTEGKTDFVENALRAGAKRGV